MKYNAMNASIRENGRSWECKAILQSGEMDRKYIMEKSMG
jgi:hypothetical protein